MTERDVRHSLEDDHRADHRGYWWTWTGDDPPQWYLDRYKHEAITSSGVRDTSGESGPIPPEIAWSDLGAYRCRHCCNGCINPVASDYYETEQCRHCYHLPSLEDKSASATDTTGASPGEASRGSGASGANASASGEPAGSDPLRVDPAAGAHPPSEARGLPNGGDD